MSGPIARALWLVIAAVLVAPAIVACSDDFCRLGPIPTLPTSTRAALIGAPDAGGRISPNTGACPAQVEYHSKLYWDLFVNGLTAESWTLTDRDLTPLGHATGAMPILPPFRDDTVYAIRDVDPGDAVAMHAASPSGTIVVLSVGRDYDLPDSLCPYFREKPTAFDWCREISPSPDGSGRTGSRTGP